jgi:Tol biopolymer transport system component
MTEDRNTLERELDRLSPPRLSLDQLAHRRDRRRRDQRIRAGLLGVAIAIAIVAGAVSIGAIRSTSPVPGEDPRPTPTPPPTSAASRGDGEFIVFAPRSTGVGWDLAARDPETGDVRTVVETTGIVDGVDECSNQGPCTNFIRKAEWSADGRWVAFEVSNASLDGPPLGPCAPTVGLWVQGPDGVPRQLTTPCDAPPSRSNDAVQELWEWSPVDARLAYARIDGEADELSVIDPSDGTRTSLVTGTIDPTFTTQASSLVWSPEGSRIAYVDGSSVYAVDVGGGERSLLADSFEDVIDIAWSPDGTQIMVHDRGRYRIQVMNADGSDLHVLLQGEDACCETAWSPNGDRIVYMLSIVGRAATGTFSSEVWTVAPDGSNPIRVFDGNRCSETNVDALPVWAPNGTQVAYKGCGGWMIENADGTGDAQPIDELVWRSWYGGGLSGWDLAGIGQIDH